MFEFFGTSLPEPLIRWAVASLEGLQKTLAFASGRQLQVGTIIVDPTNHNIGMYDSIFGLSCYYF